MKKLLSVSLFALGALAFAACAPCDTNKDNSSESESGAAPSLRLESYNYDCIGEIADADTANSVAAKYVRFKGAGVLPESDGEEGVETLRDSLLKLAEVHFNDEDEPRPDSIEGVRLTDLNAANVEAGSEVLSNLTVALVNPQVAVFEQTSYKYQAGAAHGNTAVGYVNYSVKDGKILNLSDIIANGKQAALQKLISAQLKADNVALLVSPAEVPVSDLFAITNNGLSFSYNPYEIAPYAAGVVTVTLPLSQLQEAGVLTPAGYYLITGQKLEQKAAK